MVPSQLFIRNGKRLKPRKWKMVNNLKHPHFPGGCPGLHKLGYKYISVLKDMYWKFPGGMLKQSPIMLGITGIPPSIIHGLFNYYHWS